MKKMLAKLMERNKARLDDAGLEAKQLRTELRKVEEKVDRLYDALAEGLTGDTDGFRRTLSRLEQQRDELIRRISGLDRRRDIPKGILASTNVERFTNAVRDKLTTEDPTFRRATCGSLWNGSNSTARKSASPGRSRLCFPASRNGKAGQHMVPGFDLDWWWGSLGLTRLRGGFPSLQGKYREILQIGPSVSAVVRNGDRFSMWWSRNSLTFRTEKPDAGSAKSKPRAGNNGVVRIS